MFYSYNQNNSGGDFDFDEESGITHWVIIEAPTLKKCKAIAEHIGLYWDGCSEGIDCPCCGDRWYFDSHEKGDAVPSIYGQPAKDFIKHKNFFRWMDVGKEICIHYLDGRKEWL